MAATQTERAENLRRNNSSSNGCSSDISRRNMSRNHKGSNNNGRYGEVFPEMNALVKITIIESKHTKQLVLTRTSNFDED